MSSNFIYNQLMSLNQEKNVFYINRYIKFIDSMKTKIIPTNHHIHHILPCCIFPNFKNLRENAWNAIKLSFKAHKIAHIILAKAFPCSSLSAALIFFGKDYISGTGWYNDGICNIRCYSDVAKKYNLNEGRLSTESWKNKTYVSKDGVNYQIHISELEKYLEQGYKKFLIKKKIVAVTNGETNTAVIEENLKTFLNENKIYRIGITVKSERRKNCKIYNKNGNEIRVMNFEVDTFESMGWKIGRAPEVKVKFKNTARQINKNGVGKRVSENDLQSFLNDGWKLGIPPEQVQKSKATNKNLMFAYNINTLKECKVTKEKIENSNGILIKGRSPLTIQSRKTKKLNITH